MCNEALIDLSETERLLKVYANNPPTITIQKSSMQYIIQSSLLLLALRL